MSFAGRTPKRGNNGRTFGQVAVGTLPSWRFVSFPHPEALAGFLSAVSLLKPDKRFLIWALPGFGGWRLAEFLARHLAVHAVTVGADTVRQPLRSRLYVASFSVPREWVNDNMHYVIVPIPGFKTFQLLLDEEDRLGLADICEGCRDNLPQSAYEWRRLYEAVLEDAARIFWRRIILIVPLRKSIITRLGPLETLDVVANRILV